MARIIDLPVTRSALGTNNESEKMAYLSKVKKALRAEFPDYKVYVSLVYGFEDCRVLGDPTGEVKERVLEIANQLWSE